MDPSTIGQCIIGVLICTLIWGVAFFIGVCALIAVAPKRSNASMEKSPIPNLVATCSGLAILIFALFCTAAGHEFNLPALAFVVSALPIVAGSLAIRTTGLEDTLAALRTSLAPILKPTWLITFATCLPLAVPALLPPTLFDSTMYHLAEAVNWSNSGYLYLDPYIRFPLAPLNIELLYAAAFVLHFGRYVQFITWLTFVVTATGLTAVVSHLLVRLEMPARAAEATALVTGLAFIVCPFVITFIDVAYVDVPAGCFLLAFTFAAIVSRENFYRYAIAMAFTGGTFAGTKLSLVAFVVCAAVVLIVRGRQTLAGRRWISISIATLLVFASPWFIRSLLLSGDPFDPILHLVLHQPDAFWTQADLDAQKADLHRGGAIATLPVMAFFNPNYTSGASVCVNFLFEYVPPVLLIVFAFSGRLRSALPDLVFIAAIVTAAMIEELVVTDWVIRYTLHYFASYLALLAAITWVAARETAKAFRLPAFPALPAIATILLSLLLLVPSPASAFIYRVFRGQYDEVGFALREPNVYLSNVQGYTAEQKLSSLVKASNTHLRILTVNLANLAYFFRSSGVSSIGDFFGQGRVADLVTAINTGQMKAYLNRFDIGGAMILRDDSYVGSDRLADALRRNNFVEITQPEDDVRQFVRRDVLKLAKAVGQGDDAEPVPPNTVDLEQDFTKGIIRHDATTQFVLGGRDANIFDVIYHGAYTKSITIISGYNISYAVKPEPGSTFNFDLAKVSTAGIAAVGWVDVSFGGKTKRLYSKVVDRVVGDEPSWTHVEIALPPARKGLETVTLGSSSIPGGGSGDWVAFVHPTISHAELLYLKPSGDSKLATR